MFDDNEMELFLHALECVMFWFIHTRYYNVYHLLVNHTYYIRTLALAIYKIRLRLRKKIISNFSRTCHGLMLKFNAKLREDT